MRIFRYVQLRTLRGFTAIAVGAFMLMASGAAGAITIPLQSYGTSAPGDGNSWTLNVALGAPGENLARFTFIKVASNSTGGVFGLNQILFEVGLGSILGSFIDFSFAGGASFFVVPPMNVALPDEPALVPSNPWGDGDYSAGDLLDDNFARILVTGNDFDFSLKDLNDAVTIRYGYSGTLDNLLLALLDFDGNSRIAVRVEGPETACASGSCGLAAAPLAPIPLPATAWLFVSALLGLAASARRKIRQDGQASMYPASR
ncbi:MAG: hypothetical protein R3F45_10095 [Gammaproteobacteria bacterium]